MRVAAFASIVATYEDGFRVLIEHESRATGNDMYNMRLVCCDPAIAIRPIFDHFQTVVITSGTLSPMPMYQKLLNFQPHIMCSINVSLSRQSIRPCVVTRGNDQVELTATFKQRTEPSVVRNYGLLLVELSKVVPDGMLVFFASYSHLEHCCSQWYEADGGGMRILEALEKNKLIFAEVAGSSTHDLNNVMRAYKLACENGRGAIMLAVARGRISEGIDFSGPMARAVVVLGMPFTNTTARSTQVRLRFMRETEDINESDWLLFDAARHAAQCLGRAIRGKDDYALLVLADKRFSRADRLNKMPKWLVSHLDAATKNMSIDECVREAGQHMKVMGVDDEIVQKMGIGVSLLTEAHLRDRHKIRECLGKITDIN